jgi:hypothetical protein
MWRTVVVSRILMKLGVTTVQTLRPTSVLGAIMSSPQEHRQRRAETRRAKRIGAFFEEKLCRSDQAGAVVIYPTTNQRPSDATFVG